MTTALHDLVLKIAAEVQLPIDALMQPIALLGNRESGKTYAGQKLFELAHDAGVQCVAIDIVGKWWSLRQGKDGKSKGLADVYIFGGKHADFPITADRGAFVAKVVAENHIHVVIDLSLMRKADRRRFLVDFAEELFLLKKQEDQALPCVLFLEEAHAVLPQKPQADEARMLGAFEDIVREGRNAGLGVVLMDQRPATCNKNALALVEILIALRTTYKIDRDVYVDWVVQKGIESDVKLGDVLPFLKKGQGYLYAPIYDLFQKVTIQPKRTFDASATAKVGESRKVIGTLTPVDVEKVREAMGEIVAQVANKDPAKLLSRALLAEKKLADLERKTSSSTPATVKPPKQVQVVKEGTIDKLAGVLAKAQAVVDLVAKSLADARAMGAIAAKMPPPLQFNPRDTGGVTGSGRHLPTYRTTKADLQISPSRALREAAHADGDFKPCSGELKMLGVLASRAPTALTRSQLRTLSGFTDGTFRTYGPRLHRNGLIEIHGDHYSITNAGAQFIGRDVAVLTAQTPDEVLAMWKKNLASGEAALLDLFKVNYPNTLTREAIAAEVGFTAGTLRTYLPRLERLGLITSEGGLFALHSDLGEA